MLVVRSLLFNLVFYVFTAGTLIVGTPLYLVLPQAGCMAIVRGWARVTLRLLRLICGTRWEFRGLHNLPAGAFLVAGKHQSLWETFALLEVFSNPAYVIKRQLLYVPIWGWWAWRCRMIYVDRGKGTAALRAMVARAKREFAAGRPAIIFPEGTRRAPGASPDYKPGIAQLYSQLDAPVVPMALNSGLYWPRRRFLRHPGTIVAEFLPPIAPGLRPRAFLQELETRIETACDGLLAEAAGSASAPPLPPEAAARLAMLRGDPAGFSPPGRA